MASITITTTAGHAQRLAAAVGDAIGATVPGSNTPRSATAAEVNQYITEHLTNLTRQYERKVRDAAQVDPTPITPSAT